MFTPIYLCFATRQVSDKTDLATRATSLQNKIHKQYTTSVAVSNKNSAKGKAKGKGSVKVECCADDGDRGSDSAYSSGSVGSVYAIEKDFPSVCTIYHGGSSANNTANVSTTMEIVGTVQIKPETTINNTRRGRSRTVKAEPTDISNNSNANAPTNATNTTTTNNTNMDTISCAPPFTTGSYSVLSVLCMINLLPSTGSTSCSKYSVVDVLYNCIMYEILHSPHATAVYNTNTTTALPTVDTTISDTMQSISTPTTNTITTNTTRESGFTLHQRAHTHTETGKRKLPPNTHTAITSNKMSKAYTTSTSTGTSSSKNCGVQWSCTVCTFINTTERFCAMCMQ